MNLLLVGRLNSWKGQSVLLEAVSLLPAILRARVRVRLVGGVFAAQTHFSQQLESAISELNLSDQVDLIPFTRDPTEHYLWADLVVVPSTKPEPFGLVAIEGMAAGRPVIASNHGGLVEIVVDGETGTLMRPGSAEALCAAIAHYGDDPSRMLREGGAGRKRFAAQFEQKLYKEGIVAVIAEQCLAPSP